MIADVKKSTEQKMQKSLDALKVGFSKVRSGRPHTGLLDHIMVDYYGTLTPIRQLANVTLADARTIGVVPWDKKAFSAIEKAIRDSDMGLNPMTSGEMVRVPMPPLTEERRKDLTKIVRGEAETTRVAMRNMRREANAQLKELLKDKLIAEDEDRRAQDDIQKLTDRYIAEVDKLLQTKETELMAV
ncbi:ribosome recycling factor [Nitrosomonas sp.]|uniref:ribosome recycling factor n=1 Tax=Nitrosomonas sp. TaxID=42353 RepID=UPI0025EC1684|nr:ribosome recycling factor [Nitrosomonas sp.]